MKVILDMDGTMNIWETGTPMDTVMAPGYMRHRRPHKNIIEAARLLKKHGVELFTLSAALNLPHAIPDKEYWLDKEAPFIDRDHRLYVTYDNCKKSDLLKQIGAGYGDVFLDDYNVNLREVQKGTGATVGCVKCVHKGTNDIHRSWDGVRVYTDDTPEKIATTILSVGSVMSKIRFV
ncbi:MAG: hypothetical protein LUE86_14020 [Clostridiales bacterium]|nr:hypothetical protein [Clostridiales bacterium]